MKTKYLLTIFPILTFGLMALFIYLMFFGGREQEEENFKYDTEVETQVAAYEKLEKYSEDTPQIDYLYIGEYLSKPAVFYKSNQISTLDQNDPKNGVIQFIDTENNTGNLNEVAISSFDELDSPRELFKMEFEVKIYDIYLTDDSIFLSTLENEADVFNSINHLYRFDFYNQSFSEILTKRLYNEEDSTNFNGGAGLVIFEYIDSDYLILQANSCHQCDGLASGFFITNNSNPIDLTKMQLIPESYIEVENIDGNKVKYSKLVNTETDKDCGIENVYDCSANNKIVESEISDIQEIDISI